MWKILSLSAYLEVIAAQPEPELSLLKQIWAYYFARSAVAEEPEVESVNPDLQSAPERLLDWVSPPPNWQKACNDSVNAQLDDQSVQGERAEDDVCGQLSRVFGQWQSSRTTEPGVQMVLSAPHSGVDAMVAGWSDAHGYRLVAPPTHDEIRRADGEWLSQLKQQVAELSERPANEQRLVIVGLEKYFLRTHDGLTFLRTFMDYLATEALPSLVVCQSWAWAYLTNAIHIEALVGAPFVLERIAADELAGWLTELSCGSHHRTFTFRLGQQALFTVEQGVLQEQNQDAYERFCTKLSQISRGNPGVARALWRRSISIESSVDVRDQLQSEAADDPGYTIWVQPVKSDVLPTVPATFTNEDAFILHTLLIHNGLSRSLLHQTLPLSTSLISRRLQVMLNANLVRNQEGSIEVSPLGYIPVRTFLREQGFFIDLL